MQDLKQTPNNLSCGHSVVQIQQHLNALEEKYEVELRWDHLVVLVDGGEPGLHEFKRTSHRLSVINIGLLEHNVHHHVQHLFV